MVKITKCQGIPALKGLAAKNGYMGAERLAAGVVSFLYFVNIVILKFYTDVYILLKIII